MRRLNSVFGAAPELKALTARAEEAMAMQKIWEAVAPPPLNQYSHVGLVHDGELKVYTHSSAVASKLKMQINGLLKKLQNRGVEVTSIRVEVQVASVPRVPAGTAMRISRDTAKKLLKLADQLPADSRLRKSLKQLASRA
ncbi:uncharacterized protein NMK_3108 [Novimethylophilus kurashikiensis]|uniref:DUF721 domain-containing protein n=2 Tax=Novimethylophilus kurashikiensis TaxID=1825523 RepID=A0A2R5FB83_9PROT|nr:uncharacterized protein NMK_3108 [Novimethylophilus kurashikiensis]